MNKVILNFYLISKDLNFEVEFDSRLSFKENFELLDDLSFIKDIESHYILDYYSDYPLNKNIPISTFNITNYTRLYIL